jgi:hypothetical protein
VRRREFIAGLGSAAAWPLAARAQQAAMALVEYLHPGSPEPGYFEGSRATDKSGEFALFLHAVSRRRSNCIRLPVRGSHPTFPTE